MKSLKHIALSIIALFFFYSSGTAQAVSLSNQNAKEKGWWLLAYQQDSCLWQKCEQGIQRVIKRQKKPSGNSGSD